MQLTSIMARTTSLLPRFMPHISYTASLIYIIYQLRDAIVTKTLGSTALAFVTGALIWDNAIISIGSFFFRDADTNPTKYKILKWLSYPRFTFHAVGVPLQCITVADGEVCWCRILAEQYCSNWSSYCGSSGKMLC